MIFASEVQQNENGETILLSVLVVYTGRDGRARGLIGRFFPKTDSCLEKVKRLSTPCMVKVNGAYTGKRDSSGMIEDRGNYDLIFDLIDVEEQTVSIPAH